MRDGVPEFVCVRCKKWFDEGGKLLPSIGPICDGCAENPAIKAYVEAFHPTAAREVTEFSGSHE